MKIIVMLLIMGCLFGTLYFSACGSSKKVKVGDVAPAFILIDDAGNQRSLAEFSGKKVVLYFYPKDNTPGCTKEACSLRDSVRAHKRFKEKQRLPFILLSDRKREVAHKYGTDRHILGYFYPSRKTFLINEQGIIKAIIDDVTPATHADDILKLFVD